MKNFRSIVEADIQVKHKRKYVISMFNFWPSKAISKMNKTYIREDNLELFINDNDLEVKTTNYLQGVINLAPRDSLEYEGYGDGFVRITFQIPLFTIFNYNPSEDNLFRNTWKDRDLTISRNKSFLISCTIDNENLKLDKATSERLERIFFKTKLKDKSIRDFAEKNMNITKEATFNFPEVQKEYNKFLKKYAIAQKKTRDIEIQAGNELAKYINKIVNSIAKKEKVEVYRVAADNAGSYIIFDQKGFDFNKALSLINRYDKEIWAIDTNQASAKKDNEDIIVNMRKMGTGIFTYTTHPGGKETQIKVSL